MSRYRLIAPLIGVSVVAAALFYLYTPPVAPTAPRPASSSAFTWDQEVIAWNDADPPITTAKRSWLVPREGPLRDAPVLILTDAATGRGDMAIFDADALQAAQGKAFIEHAHMSNGSSIFVSIISLGQALSKVSTVAYSGHGGWIFGKLSCWYCAHDDASAKPRDFAGLLDHGHPVEELTLTYESRDAYDAAFKTLRRKDGVWVVMSGSFWSQATDTAPASGRIVTWQLVQ